jgi:N utilization substance protein B
MSRRRAREYALQILFQIDLTESGAIHDLLDDFWKGSKEGRDVQDFANDLVRGTIQHLNSLDEVIRKSAEHWQLGRMAVVDKSILRAAAYELLFRPDIPPSVTINEAIEIAKKFSTVESASFIHGILDNILKALPIGDSPSG